MALSGFQLIDEHAAYFLCDNTQHIFQTYVDRLAENTDVTALQESMVDASSARATVAR